MAWHQKGHSNVTGVPLSCLTDGSTSANKCIQPEHTDEHHLKHTNKTHPSTQTQETTESHTWMHMLDVPDEDGVDETVQDHHERDHEEVVLVPLHRGDVDVVVLHPNTHLLIEGKVLGAQAKGCGGEQRLERERRCLMSRIKALAGSASYMR